MKRKIPFTRLLIVSARRYKAAKVDAYHRGFEAGVRDERNERARRDDREQR